MGQGGGSGKLEILGKKDLDMLQLTQPILGNAKLLCIEVLYQDGYNEIFQLQTIFHQVQ